MKREELYDIFVTNPAIHIIRLKNAHWVLPFLFGIYKEQNRTVLQESQLIQLLIETLIANEDGIEDVSEAKIIFGDDEQTRSRKYLYNWVQKRLLQDFQHTDGLVYYQLSASTEKVFQWVQTLKVRKHVGTESRFRLLFNSLQDIVEHTEEDSQKRLSLLKDKRAEIDKEIKAIELGVQPESYSGEQVQERLELFTRLSYELISDFREVEDNFKQIHRSIVEQHTKTEQSKGAIVGFAFEAYDALRQNTQGKSFYAFWDFLISRVGNQHWAELTDRVVQLVNEREIPSDSYFLQNVKSMLLLQGKTVYEANDKMAEKLSRIITEKEITKHRRLRRQIAAVKELIFDLMDDNDVLCGMYLEEGPNVKMVMERKLMLQQKKGVGIIQQPLAQKQVITDPDRFSKMVNTSFIDRKKLWLKVEAALEKKTTATLKEILEDQPLENGIAEIVSYYGFMRDKKSRVQVIGNATELIPLNVEATRFAEVPYLLFSK
jgi:hypothetical protein